MHSPSCDALRRNISTDIIIAPAVLRQASIRFHCHLEFTTNDLPSKRRPYTTPKSRSTTLSPYASIQGRHHWTMLTLTTAPSSPLPPLFHLAYNVSQTWAGSLQDPRTKVDPQRHLEVHSSHLHDPPANNAMQHATPSSSASTRTMFWTVLTPSQGERRHKLSVGHWTRISRRTVHIAG